MVFNKSMTNEMTLAETSQFNYTILIDRKHNNEVSCLLTYSVQNRNHCIKFDF